MAAGGDGLFERLRQRVADDPDLEVLAAERGSWPRLRERRWFGSYVPCADVRISVGVGCVVSMITMMAVWAGNGGSVPGGGSLLALLLRPEFLGVIAMPGALAALTNFVSLCGLGPGRSRSLLAWANLFWVSGLAIVFAVGLATLHLVMLSGSH